MHYPLSVPASTLPLAYFPSSLAIYVPCSLPSFTFLRVPSTFMLGRRWSGVACSMEVVGFCLSGLGSVGGMLCRGNILRGNVLQRDVL